MQEFCLIELDIVYITYLWILKLSITYIVNSDCIVCFSLDSLTTHLSLRFIHMTILSISGISPRRYDSFSLQKHNPLQYGFSFFRRFIQETEFSRIPIILGGSCLSVLIIFLECFFWNFTVWDLFIISFFILFKFFSKCFIVACPVNLNMCWWSAAQFHIRLLLQCSSPVHDYIESKYG